MKRVIGFLLVFSYAVGQASNPAAGPTLPHDGVGAAVWYNQGATPRWNGTFYQFTQMPGSGAMQGTYLYNAVDFLPKGKQIMTVPQTGLAQHVMWIGKNGRIELFALAGAGAAVSPTSKGTDVSAAFSGGGGLAISVGKGWKITPLAKTIQAGGVTNLVGGLGFQWGH